MPHKADLEIPLSLRKTQTKETTMTHAEKPTRKPRVTQQLPTTIIDGNSEIVIADLGLEELVRFLNLTREQLADMPKLELEARALSAEIRRKARV
jgi:hypothetical protein